MPVYVEPIVISSKEELKSRLSEIVDLQTKNSIVGIRGIRLTEEEQLQLVKDLGDIAGWVPNNSDTFSHKYIENHSSNSSVKKSTGDQIILSWHLEHVDYDEYIPLVAGVWNMRVFNCDPESGKTYFIDSRKIFKYLFSEKEKEFLRRCKATWVEDDSDGEKYRNYVNAVQNHWKTSEEQIRIELYHSSGTELYLIDGREPNLEEKTEFFNLVKKFEYEVFNNEEIRIIHRWEEGDILIPDLFSLAHAVTGGFDSKDREFTGFWCYLLAPSAVEEERLHPKWRPKL